MGKITIGPGNSDNSRTVEHIPRAAPMIQYIDRIIEKPVEVIVEKIIEIEIPIETIVERIVEKPVEIIVEKEKIVYIDKLLEPTIVEKRVDIMVPDLSLYNELIIEFNLLTKKHEKLKNKLKIIIPIMLGIALIGLLT